MISQDLLKEATKLIGGDRQTDYGDKLTNHQNIADFWSIFLKKKNYSARCCYLYGLGKSSTAHEPA